MSSLPGSSDPLAKGLYIVATPVGNARDITLRALETLALADVILSEDTRVTAKLLSLHGISGAKTLSYHEHNAEKVRPNVIKRLENGESVALVSDAGTPLINDPGYKLVRDCRDRDLPVTSLPGACSPILALTLAGLPTDRFFYGGFLPPKSAARKKVLASLADLEATLVFLEAPRRLADCLADARDILGTREASVTRELTKRFEEVRTAPLADLAATYAEMEPPKGEVVIVFGPPGEKARISADEVDGMLRDALASLRVKDAAGEVAARTGLNKRDLYRRALELSGK